MDLQLTGKVAAVTGASKGIGLAVVRRLLDEGARVVAASRTLSPELESLAGQELVHVRADLSRPDAPGEVIARAAESFGGLDALVNNIGGGPEIHGSRVSFTAVSDADWQATLELNLLASVRATRAALPMLVERGGGAIVNICSVNARRPVATMVDYSVAKAALLNLTKALSEEYAGQGIRVNAISPGPVRTSAWADGALGEEIASDAGVDRDTALTRVVPERLGLTTGAMIAPEEIADLAAYLVSPLVRNTTGSDFIIDAGFLKNF